MTTLLSSIPALHLISSLAFVFRLLFSSSLFIRPLRFGALRRKLKPTVSGSRASASSACSDELASATHLFPQHPQERWASALHSGARRCLVHRNFKRDSLKALPRCRATQASAKTRRVTWRCFGTELTSDSSRS